MENSLPGSHTSRVIKIAVGTLFKMQTASQNFGLKFNPCGVLLSVYNAVKTSIMGNTG